MNTKHLPSASKNDTRRSEYETCYDRDMGEILHNHRHTDLFAEIELIRYLNLVTLKRMNAEGKKLTYRDQLATLRAVTLAAGEIAHLASMHNKVFSPLIILEERYKQEMDDIYQRLMNIAELVIYKDKEDPI